METRKHDGIEVIDAGHRYDLASIDGLTGNRLQFVKRCDLKNPARFPGNLNAYPGTTMQIVIRVVLDRIQYLQNQIWCPENAVITKLLQAALWLLEFRAARRHKRSYWHGLKFAAEAPICTVCGHTVCEHEEGGRLML